MPDFTVTARIAGLQKAIAPLHLHLLGVQESRIKGKQIRQMSNYFEIQSGATEASQL